MLVSGKKVGEENATIKLNRFELAWSRKNTHKKQILENNLFSVVSESKVELGKSQASKCGAYTHGTCVGRLWEHLIQASKIQPN